MTTEIAVLKLVSPKLLSDEFFAESGDFKQTLITISESDGFERGFWGLEDEDKTKVRVFMIRDIASIEGSEERASAAFRLLEDVEDVEIFRVNFAPDIPVEPLDPQIAHNTMVETIYFDGKFPHKDGWVANFDQKVKNILRENETRIQLPGFKAAAGGWAVHKSPSPTSGEDCVIWFALVGWPSMQAHLEWRESPSHHENQKLLEQYKDWWRCIVRVHCSMSEFTRTSKPTAIRVDSPRLE